MLPALTKLKASNPDVILLHLHSAPTALVIRQARNSGIELPIVAGSAMHQPSTARLLKADQLRGVCAETAASPISELNNEVIKFTTEYKKRFATAPDAFALAQYDGMNMVIAALKSGAKTAIEVRNWLATNTFKGLAMSYKSDGKGNMAHDATIVCYDGKTRIPKIIQRYLNVDGVF